MPDTVGIVVAAGSARRMGENKMLMRIGRKSVLERTLNAFEQAKCFDRVIIVCQKGDMDTVKALAELALTVPFIIVEGGSQRQFSVENALNAAKGAGIVAVHDGARCFINPQIIRQCVIQASRTGAAAAGVRTKDTIKQLDNGKIVHTIDRTHLVNIQTPQAFSFNLLLDAHQKAKQDGFVGTDECSLLERLGIPIMFVNAHYDNIKITTKEDLGHGRYIVGEQIRNGTGYDVHKLVEGLPLVLGGVTIPHTHGLLGHSDADVLLHAVMDAMLGAAAAGDIGQHFPGTDEFKDISSLVLLKRTHDIITDKGYNVINIDSTIIMQRPKAAPYIMEMRQNIAKVLEIDLDAVSVKATTTEGLGFEGRCEGVSAMASATLIG